MSSTTKWLRRASLFFLILIPIIALLAVATYTVYWVFGVNVIGNNAIVLATTQPLAERRIYGLVAAAPSLLLWLVALFWLFQVFHGFIGGAFFARTTINYMRKFSLFTCVSVVLDIAFSGVRRWAAGVFDDAPLYTHIGISMEHLLLVFMALAFYTISFVLLEADRYKQEIEDYI